MYLASNKLKKIENLDHFAETIENLELGSNKISVIENLEKLVKLKDLVIAKNKIT